MREDREWRVSRTSEGELVKMVDYYLFDVTIFNLIFNNNNNNSSHFYSTITDEGEHTAFYKVKNRYGNCL